MALEYFSEGQALLLLPSQGKIATLNVSVAAGIVLFETARQRRAAKNKRRQP